MPKQSFSHQVRYHINRFIFDHGFAPNVQELAELVQSKESVVSTALHELEKNRSLVLHPGTTEIWIAHPFALFPTNFWVVSGDRKWWGNCTWCSFGIASLCSNHTIIYTRLEGKTQSLKLNISQGKLVESNYVVHFSQPALHMWDNVVHFCACTLVYEDERAVESWCNYHRIQKGKVVPIQQVWELAKVWYGYYLDPEWRPKSLKKAELIFEQVGFEGDFWKLS